MPYDTVNIPLKDPAPAPWVFDGLTLRDANGRLIGNVADWSEENIHFVINCIGVRYKDTKEKPC